MRIYDILGFTWTEGRGGTRVYSNPNPLVLEFAERFHVPSRYLVASNLTGTSVHLDVPEQVLWGLHPLYYSPDYEHLYDEPPGSGIVPYYVLQGWAALKPPDRMQVEVLFEQRVFPHERALRSPYYGGGDDDQGPPYELREASSRDQYQRFVPLPTGLDLSWEDSDLGAEEEGNATVLIILSNEWFGPRFTRIVETDANGNERQLFSGSGSGLAYRSDIAIGTLHVSWTTVPDPVGPRSRTRFW